MMLAAILTICCTATLTSCGDEIGMNEPNAYYAYTAYSNDFSYQEAAGPFNAAILFAVGKDPILGGNDEKVKEACDKCYEELKPKLQGKSGKVIIYKTRHPDGKQMDLKKYKF